MRKILIVKEQDYDTKTIISFNKKSVVSIKLKKGDKSDRVILSIKIDGSIFKFKCEVYGLDEEIEMLNEFLLDDKFNTCEISLNA